MKTQSDLLAELSNAEQKMELVAKNVDDYSKNNPPVNDVVADYLGTARAILSGHKEKFAKYTMLVYELGLDKLDVGDIMDEDDLRKLDKLTYEYYEDRTVYNFGLRANLVEVFDGKKFHNEVESLELFKELIQ